MQEEKIMQVIIILQMQTVSGILKYVSAFALRTRPEQFIATMVANVTK